RPAVRRPGRRHLRRAGGVGDARVHPAAETVLPGGARGRRVTVKLRRREGRNQHPERSLPERHAPGLEARGDARSRAGPGRAGRPRRRPGRGRARRRGRTAHCPRAGRSRGPRSGAATRGAQEPVPPGARFPGPGHGPGWRIAAERGAEAAPARLGHRDLPRPRRAARPALSVTPLAAPAAMQPARSVRGIVAMLLAVGFFSLMDGGLKHLAGHYPPLQVAALRGLSALPLVTAWVLLSGRFHTLWRVRWGLHLLRAVLSVGMLAAFAYGLDRMPLASAYALFFVAPLLITALSVPLLGEKVGPRRWVAIGVGLLGVLVALRPGGQGMAS